MIARLGAAGVSVWASALAVPMLLAAAAVTSRPVPELPSWSELAALAYLGLVATAGAFCLGYASTVRLGVERAGLFTGVVPVSALFAGVALGQSQLALGRVAGASAVGAGIALGLSSSRRRHGPARSAAGGGSLPRSAAAGRRAASGVSP
jgi:drug/metabolite transporter (DMT)-like permease